MRILAIDTTSEFGSIALFGDGVILVEHSIHAPDGFGRVLFSEMRGLLHEHGWTLESIDRFAAAAGPGSFTGVRIGLTAAKGLAEAVGKPAVAVSNLRALAACGTSGVRAAAMDARRDEVYAAVYDCELRPVIGESVLPFSRWLNGLPKDVEELIGNDIKPFREHLAGVRLVEQRTLAAAVARIAARAEAHDPAALDANYVRRSDAELKWVDR